MKWYILLLNGGSDGNIYIAGNLCHLYVAELPLGSFLGQKHTWAVNYTQSKEVLWPNVLFAGALKPADFGEFWQQINRLS